MPAGKQRVVRQNSTVEQYEFVPDYELLRRDNSSVCAERKRMFISSCVVGDRPHTHLLWLYIVLKRDLFIAIRMSLERTTQ